MSVEDDVADILSQVVVLGQTPTAQELELGEAVARHISERQSRPALRPCPTCGGTGRVQGEP
jgi:hypothetical protein